MIQADIRTSKFTINFKTNEFSYMQMNSLKT